MISFQEQMQRWGNVADRSLSRFEQMTIARPFVYSPFFGTWSRILKPVMQGHPQGMILLNLTPETSTLRQMKLFVSDNLFRREDKFERQLPNTIMELLVAKVGLEQTMFMTECDLWPMIDVDKFVQARRGRNPFDAIPFALVRLAGTEGMPA
jgi:hypothetical protein